VLIKSHIWTLFWARLIQSTVLHNISSRYVLILFSRLRLGLPNSLFPLNFILKFCMNFSSPIHATCSSHPTLLDFVTLIIVKYFKVLQTGRYIVNWMVASIMWIQLHACGITGSYLIWMRKIRQILKIFSFSRCILLYGPIRLILTETLSKGSVLIIMCHTGICD
jgi:hypothetical protein